MGEGNGDWLRARGIGRERFAGYLTEYLGSIGYRVERTERTEPMETHVKGELERMSPSVPPAAHSLAFRLYPTSGGAAGSLAGPDRGPRGPETAHGPARPRDGEPLGARRPHREPRDGEGRSPFHSAPPLEHADGRRVEPVVAVVRPPIPRRRSRRRSAAL